MFTGIIQYIGMISKKDTMGSAIRITIDFQEEVVDLVKGESIALDGICLTVEEFAKKSYTCYVSCTTAECTNINSLHIGSFVNLERALRPIDRMGGHFVTGHIDTIAKLVHKEEQEGSLLLKFEINTEYSPYILNKGSIAINGISLTVASCTQNSFTVTIIPETQIQTTIKHWYIGESMNIETDIIGKYVINLLSRQANTTSLTKEVLFDNGFFK